jgi:class 3 adenylate cyclase
MPGPRIIPALADLTQDIAGPLPLRLLQGWATGAQDLETADRLLDDFRIEGHVVSTDTSGLSYMTHEKDLLEVMSLISVPKGIVHALGKEIGGRPIGIWVADNSEMYYPSRVDPLLILDCLTESRYRIARAVPIELGFCVHAGHYYEIGGGLYGDDASTVERLAEEFADPGEILVTAAVADPIDPSLGVGFDRRPTLDAIHPPGVYTLRSERRLPALRGEDSHYPHPFPADFFRQLSALPAAIDAEAARRRMYDQYQAERSILFVARERSRAAEGDLATLLDDLLLNALTDAILRETLRASSHVAGSGGGLGILTFSSPSEALDFALLARLRFAENGVLVRIAIDHGPVLIFDGIRGRNGISGDPVNIASKLSEDAGENSRIVLTDRAAAGLRFPGPAERFETVISRVPIRGWIL